MKIRGLDKREQNKFTHFFLSGNKASRKKGQEVVSNFGIVGIVGIIFLVVVVLGIWYVNTRATQASTQVPDNAAIIAQACSAVASESTINSYCLQLREIKSNVYATCDKMADQNIVVTDSDGSAVNIAAINDKCKQYASQLTAKIQEACSTGDYKGKPNTEINKQLCSYYTTGLKCTGTASLCTDTTKFSNERTCNAQAGCTWVADKSPLTTGKCGGIAVACTSIVDLTDLSKCKNQNGCKVE